jgi:tetratricopeptide (TPR) repeat protein
MFPPSQDLGFVDVEKTKNLFLNTYIWGNANKKNVYFDEKNRIMFVSYRLSAARLAETLAAMNRSKEGIAVLDKVMANITEQAYYYDFTAIYVAMAYYRCGAFDKANALTKKLVKNADDDITWISNLNENFKESLYNDVRRDIQGIYMLLQSAQQAGDANGTKTLNDKFTQLQKLPIVQLVMQQQ